MRQGRDRTPGQFILCVALRHLGTEREILVLKVSGQNFYAFPPYAKKPLGSVDCHISWHRSGCRHAVWRQRPRPGMKLKDVDCTGLPIFAGKGSLKKLTEMRMQRPQDVKGADLLVFSGIFVGQFLQLLPVGTNTGKSIVLDAHAARFRDDYIAIKAYLVEPGAAASIPVSADTGPRILYLIKSTTPWIAVDVFQQSLT